MKYDPNGGTLHDLAAYLTRWGVGDEVDLYTTYEIIELLGKQANREYGKKVDIHDLAQRAMFAFPEEFNRETIQANLDRIVEAFS